jgi:hypothetical protein
MSVNDLEPKAQSPKANGLTRIKLACFSSWLLNTGFWPLPQ